jgi:hypothetical protein
MMEAAGYSVLPAGCDAVGGVVIDGVVVVAVDGVDVVVDDGLTGFTLFGCTLRL